MCSVRCTRPYQQHFFAVSLGRRARRLAVNMCMFVFVRGAPGRPSRHAHTHTCTEQLTHLVWTNHTVNPYALAYTRPWQCARFSNTLRWVVVVVVRSHALRCSMATSSQVVRAHSAQQDAVARRRIVFVCVLGVFDQSLRLTHTHTQVRPAIRARSLVVQSSELACSQWCVACVRIFRARFHRER